jgi:hypothetical protein
MLVQVQVQVQAGPTIMCLDALLLLLLLLHCRCCQFCNSSNAVVAVQGMLRTFSTWPVCECSALK